MKQNTWAKLGKLLKEAREKKDLTQLEVATSLGYTSSQYISNFERGLCAPPLANLGKLTKIYQLDKRMLQEILVEGYEAEVNRALFGKAAK